MELYLQVFLGSNSSSSIQNNTNVPEDGGDQGGDDTYYEREKVSY